MYCLEHTLLCEIKEIIPIPVFEFRLTCMNEDSCKKTRLSMYNFKNKTVKDKSYDHTAVKTFSSWEDAIISSHDIEKRLGNNLVDLTIIEK